MRCWNCGVEYLDNMAVCPACQARADDAGKYKPNVNNAPEKEENEKTKNNPVLITVIISVAAVLLAAVIAVAFVFSNKDKKEDNTETTEYSSTTQEETTEEKTEETTKEKKTTTQKKTTTTKKIISNELYRPASSYYVDQYSAYVFCTDTDVQNYVKMRYGPDKTKYDVVTEILNDNEVTVESKGINGWVLCYYNGFEGWIRSDFVFKLDKEEAYDDYDFNIPYIISAEGRESINMRSEATSDSELVATIPVTEEVFSPSEEIRDGEWTYVRYKDDFGWVKSEYIYVCGSGDKPVLYLYPEKKTDVNVKLKTKNLSLTCTYPRYHNGWSVTANPDGTVINKADGMEYSYLYWEFFGRINYDFSKGFVVKGSDTLEFLQKTLPKMGLLPREYNEFIVYWLPKMQNNRYNLISFQTTAYTDNCQLEITPKPDSLLRVFMAYKPLDRYIEVPPQTFKKFERKGFTAVEWGGTEVNY